MIEQDQNPSRGGRKRDASRDSAILHAAIDTLGEVGFERMTMDMVAARAGAGKATVYRRWPSKEALVLDAVAQTKRDQVDLDQLPDTGSFRGDMLALFRPKSVAETERKLRAMAGVATLLSFEPGLSDAASDALVGPWVAANRILMERAVTRGEASASAPIDTLATIIPSLGAFRSLVQRQAFDRAFLEAMLDDVVLPALGIRTEAPSKPVSPDLPKE
ncbi:TetR/AcrR family transcriptional regulator [Aureimonas psammosilenae]|uniref:TetR/AcrR family transcriptional regulator n=1 Tax=Aureimonas psammosilenae TaxID=2495496 RepID=UPI001AEF21C2|nr:TetR/AcrR family transcriptional regulator [Aureimonas psammosilenae]